MTEAQRTVARLNALGASNGARLIAFNASLAKAPLMQWTPSGFIPLRPREARQ